jgi:alpha-ribazole phosphatase
LSGTATRFLWIRHAPSAGAEGRWMGRRSDPHAVLPAPADLGPLWDACSDIDLAVTSPLRRARETAGALFPEHAPRVVEALAEQDFGDWDGRAYADASMPPGLDAKGIAGFRPPAGESFADLLERVRPAIAGLAETHADRRLAVVAHGGVIRAALAMAMNADASSAVAFDIAPLSLTSITLFGGGGARIDHVNRVVV